MEKIGIKTQKWVVSLPTKLVLDRGLSCEEIGFLMKLMALPDDFITYQKGLATISGKSVPTIEKYLKHLEEVGLIEKEVILKPDGSIDHIQYTVTIGNSRKIEYEEKTKEKEKKKTFRDFAEGIPEKVIVAFEEFEAYRKELKLKAYVDRTLKAKAKEIKEEIKNHGEQFVIDSIHKSIAQGYQGIFFNPDRKNETKTKKLAF